MDTVFDVCVVGAGVEGSSAARYLATTGKNTLLIEQFPLPHSRGSSHGQSRLVRYGYPEPFHTALMPESFQMWSEVEEKAGKRLISKVGLLTLDRPPYDEMSKVITNVRNVGQECVQMTAEEIVKRFPGLTVPPEECGALETTSGYIVADLALRCLQEQFVEYGGILCHSEKVLDIQPGSVVDIKTTKTCYKAKSVIITVDRFPGYIFSKPLGKKNHIYGFPVFEYPGLIKICPHDGVEIADPDFRDFPSKEKDQLFINRVAALIKAQFPGVKAEPGIVETCIYTVTPDHLFVLDRHPEYRNIIIGAGFSGHGFKMAPVVGKILSQLALDEKVTYDILPFRLSRFSAFKEIKSSL
ncbi:Peroxisomal sarcosine oxidase [Acropora cervicornis]|uniref:Peroxisomal sarcosine oxidase n=1 Tax=Acropora cervicornis TaxID=6130 RepID=A0AAD9QBL9_ACRCE|nr:Peroxisomal sarcosine oxidase [Acropora cervicornis]